jgi:hypothetical protein
MAASNYFPQYLRQAINALRIHSLEPSGSTPAWSALYTSLTALLGNRLTNLFRKAGKLKHDYRYIGTAVPWQFDKKGAVERGTGEHVIPLTCIIEALIAHSELWASEADLEAFLVEHIVMADVPQVLNRRLPPETMPDPYWACQVGPGGFSSAQKMAAVWSRYANIPGITVPNPFGSGDFIKLAAGAAQKSRQEKAPKTRVCHPIIYSPPALV